MTSKDKIIEIFCSVDNFCKEFIPFWQKHLILNGKKRHRSCKLSLSETMTIQILFHLSGYRTFKEFYLGYVKEYLTDEFPSLVSYNLGWYNYIELTFLNTILSWSIVIKSLKSNYNTYTLFKAKSR